MRESQDTDLNVVSSPFEQCCYLYLSITICILVGSFPWQLLILSAQDHFGRSALILQRCEEPTQLQPEPAHSGPNCLWLQLDWSQATPSSDSLCSGPQDASSKPDFTQTNNNSWSFPSLVQFYHWPALRKVKHAAWLQLTISGQALNMNNHLFLKIKFTVLLIHFKYQSVFRPKILLLKKQQSQQG